MSVNSDLNKRQRETVAGTGNPPKWPDWGIYNYKAVVAYDGTTYKCAHLHAYHAADSHASYTCLTHIQCLLAMQIVCSAHLVAAANL